VQPDSYEEETTMARPPQHRKTSPTPTPLTPPIDNTAATPVAGPVFAQPKPTADPTRFSINHPSDDAAYKTIDALNAQHKLGPIPFPAPRGGVESVLTLAQVLGKGGDDAVMSGRRSLIKGYFWRCAGRGCGHVFGLLLRRIGSAGPDVVR
jgi:hypothetical protein